MSKKEKRKKLLSLPKIDTAQPAGFELADSESTLPGSHASPSGPAAQLAGMGVGAAANQPVGLADAAPTQQRQSYLEHVKMTSFGKFSNAVVGPFGPGLNVVYGPNEAGKTTLNELIKGVLFGWPSARGANNPYRPEGAHRVGSLFFRKSDNSVLELKRARNADGVNAPEGFLDDIDQQTYQTMFALTSDELMGLDGHNEITAHLLTAGAGTPSSPAHALDRVEERIRQALSRSAQYPNSIPNLNAEMERLREQVHIGREEADSLRAQQKQLANLRAKRQALSQETLALNNQIESLKTAAAQVEKLDADLEQARTAMAVPMQPAEEAAPTEELLALAALDPAEEYRLRDALDELEAKHAKLDRAVDAALEAANRSQAEFEAASDSAAQQQARRSGSLWRKAAVVASALIAAALVAAGVFLLLRDADFSLAFIGTALIVLAVAFGAGAIVLAMRPQKTDQPPNEDLKKKQWEAAQEAKNLEVCERALAQHNEQAEAYLASVGLAGACGSPRRGIRMLDQASALRHAQAHELQAKQALELQQAQQRTAIAEMRRVRIELCRASQLPDNAQASHFKERIAQLEAQRFETTEQAGSTERQIGEISERLDAATNNTSFDRAKFQYEEANARLKAAQRNLAVLFTAKHALQNAIAAWDSQSQPQVYRMASKLFSSMTDGAWQQVRTNAEGEVEVVDAVLSARAPHLLSLGTRQQLYLSLRLALLITAQDVGRALPVLCDDILVNFDDKRRVAAARALAELARHRQVILFTCHRDVAALVADADPSCKLLEL